MKFRHALIVKKLLWISRALLRKTNAIPNQPHVEEAVVVVLLTPVTEDALHILAVSYPMDATRSELNGLLLLGYSAKS